MMPDSIFNRHCEERSNPRLANPHCIVRDCFVPRNDGFVFNLLWLPSPLLVLSPTTFYPNNFVITENRIQKPGVELLVTTPTAAGGTKQSQTVQIRSVSRGLLRSSQ